MQKRRRNRLRSGGCRWLWAAAGAALVLGILLGRRRGQVWMSSLSRALKEAALNALSEVFRDEAA